MHESIQRARHPLICDLCGQTIQQGERFRSVREEYSAVTYHEHLQCPGTATVESPITKTPVTPKQNHACCMA